MVEKKWILGMDLNPKEAQICFYDREKGDAASASQGGSGEGSTFPLSLCRVSEEEWYHGTEAAYFAKKKNGILVDQLYELCRDGQKWNAEDRSYTGGELLGIFLARSLRMMGIREPEREVTGIVITVPAITRPMVQAVTEAYEYVGIPRSRGYLQNYKESFYVHTLCQKQELWARKVGLFHFQGEGEVKFSCLEANFRTKPVTVQVKDMGHVRLTGQEEEKDEQLYGFAARMLGNEVYSCIFLMGAEFDPSWAEKTTAFLCKGHRKVFGGTNLFAKGAAYSAKEKVLDKSLKGYLYMGSDLVLHNIGMEMQIQGSPAYYPLITAGVNWYEAEKECEFLLDGVKDLIFVVRGIDGKEKHHYGMTLPGLPERPKKATRLKLNVQYESPTLMRISVKDLGLGDIFPSSGKEWQETMEG